MSGDEIKVKVTDRRSAIKMDGEAPDVESADLERLPTYVEQLKKEMEDHDAKLKEYIKAYKEKMAENDRFRVRIEKDVDRRVEMKLADILRELLPVLDSTDLALKAADSSPDNHKLREGFSLIHAGLMAVLSKYGMNELDLLNRKFDPAVAEAVGIEEVTESEKDDVVLEVVQPGYMLNGILLRPAKVRVGRLADS